MRILKLKLFRIKYVFKLKLTIIWKCGHFAVTDCHCLAQNDVGRFFGFYGFFTVAPLLEDIHKQIFLNVVLIWDSSEAKVTRKWLKKLQVTLLIIFTWEVIDFDSVKKYTPISPCLNFASRIVIITSQLTLLKLSIFINCRNWVRLPNSLNHQNLSKLPNSFNYRNLVKLPEFCLIFLIIET